MTRRHYNEMRRKMPIVCFNINETTLHGSPKVTGYHASHGCIRLLTEDAKWLNTQFVDVGNTPVIIRPY